MKKILTGLSLMFVMSANVFADTPLLMNDLNIVGGCNILNLGVVSGDVQLIPTFELTTYVCNPGYYLPKDTEGCIRCSENFYCAGGAFQYDVETDQGIMECPNSWYSPMGMSSAAQCGRILHVGDSVIYLRSVKKTTPSLNVRVGDDVFYGNMTMLDVQMNADTEHKLKLRFDDTTWSVYDDTVNITEIPE